MNEKLIITATGNKLKCKSIEKLRRYSILNGRGVYIRLLKLASATHSSGREPQQIRSKKAKNLDLCIG